MKQNKKKNNAKIVLPIIIGLTCVTGVGIGFSSWIISSQQVNTSHSITVNTADIVDKRVEVAVNESASGFDASVTFGPATSDSTAPITTDGNDEEDLSFTIIFTVTEKTEGNLKNFSKFSLAFDTADYSSQNYIVFPTDVDISVTDGALQAVAAKVKVSKDSLVTTVTYTDNFAWGTTFNSQNPSLATDDIDTVRSNIEAMNNMFNGKSFTLNITSTLVSE